MKFCSLVGWLVGRGGGEDYGYYGDSCTIQILANTVEWTLAKKMNKGKKDT